MDDEWHVVQRKKKETKHTPAPYVPISLNHQKGPIPTKFPKRDVQQKPVNVPIEEKKEIVDLQHIVGNGQDIMLNYEYVLWVHSTQNNDWSLAGYKKLCTIKNVSEFWRLFNNIQKLNFKNNNFFLMKSGVNPIWEDEHNRGGGICSLRIEMDHALKVYELLCIFLMCDKLVNDIDDINGISITPKNNWAILKIWNKNKHNKIDKLLNKSIMEKYKNVSIQYKENQPEY
jgi:hypothetical protein